MDELKLSLSACKFGQSNRRNEMQMQNRGCPLFMRRLVSRKGI
jgi:hypothetical protein